VRVVDVSREAACLGATESSRVAAQSQFKIQKSNLRTTVSAGHSSFCSRRADVWQRT
jgi:hypothetical protein